MKYLMIGLLIAAIVVIGSVFGNEPDGKPKGVEIPAATQAEIDELTDQCSDLVPVDAPITEFSECANNPEHYEYIEPVVNPKPKGTYDASCDYLLGNFTASDGGYRFVGTAAQKNSGNVGIVAKVTGKWFQIGGPPITQTKMVRVPYAGRKRTTFSIVASGDQIDQIQALPYDNQCKVNVTIIDSFGSVQ